MNSKNKKLLRRVITLCTILVTLTGGLINAQPYELNQQADKPKPTKAKRNPPKSLTLSMVRGTQLKGYQDPFFVGNDKEDYIRVGTTELNFEFVGRQAKSSNSLFGNYLVYGGYAGFTTPDKAVSKILPKISPFNASEQVYSIAKNHTASGGVFIGADYNSFEFDLGFKTLFDFTNEKKRLRYKEINNTTEVEEVAGRGWFIEKMSLIPTILARFGKKDSVNFNIFFHREQFSAMFDSLYYSIFLPITSWFDLEAGNGLLPQASVFIKPILHLSENIDWFAKGSSTIKYYDTNLTKISIGDTFFVNTGFTYRIR